MHTPDKLEQGRKAYRLRKWSDAYQALTLADQAKSLNTADLGLLATSAYMVGQDPVFQDCIERAHFLHKESHDREQAARCAFWLGLTLLLRGESGQANGWLARARRLVEGRDCVEHGYLLLPRAEQQLHGHEYEAAHATAVAAAAIGDRFGDADVIACARHLQGRALIRQGRVQAGLALLDEAMLAAIAERLSPIFTGLIYCSVIQACRQVYALSRAREWTAALARWCERQSGMVAFTGTCLVHRAELMQLQGDWPGAMTEACRACERFPEPAAAALYQQAEIHRLRGESAAADAAYRNASQAGSEPQPGLALLRMVQGRTDAAGASIRRVASATADPLQRAKLLPAYVDIMLAADAVPEAREACRDLAKIAGEFDTDMLRAMAAHACGAVELAESNARAALVALRTAFGIWQELGAAYEAARVRVLLGLACRALGDDEACALEFAAARAVFESLGAAPDLARLDADTKRATSADRSVLTPRELQVLRLIATGMTNKIIAAELSLSERTIDRHVSNILGKLDVASRAAAIACAYDRKLL